VVAASAVVHLWPQLSQFVTGVADNPRTPDTSGPIGPRANPGVAAGLGEVGGGLLVLTLGFLGLAFVLQKQMRAAQSVLRSLFTLKQKLETP